MIINKNKKVTKNLY